MTDWKASLRADPIPWLLENACAPIRYRVLTELLDRRRDDPQVVELRKDVLNDAAARKLERTQRKDGSWEGDGVGAVYGTAIALTILQLPYSLVPIYQR